MRALLYTEVKQDLDSAMSTARLSSKSQIVVPAEVRRKLGLKPGDEVIVEVEGDHAVLRKAEASPLEALLAFGREHGHVDRAAPAPRYSARWQGRHQGRPARLAVRQH